LNVYHAIHSLIYLTSEHLRVASEADAFYNIRMVQQHRDDALGLMQYVWALEGKNSAARGRQVQSALAALGLKVSIQKCRYPRIRNIIVDFPARASQRRLLFSAHYDAVKGTPAANDNASGVAVLLGLCQELQQSVSTPVRVVFFDREEAWLRTPFFRLGLLGSMNYAFRTDLKDIAAVYNLEFCGLGRSVAMWPVKRNQQELPAVRSVVKAAAKLQVDIRYGHIPWFFLSSDHLPFRFRGLSDAVTLSLLPDTQAAELERFMSGTSIPRLLTGGKPALPGVLASLHTADDNSTRLSEDSLRLMLSLVREIIQDYQTTIEQSKGRLVTRMV